MKRKDVIFEKLKEAGMHGGMSAGELAKRLGLDRANVSRDLNELWREGKVRKRPGRPVRFSVPAPPSDGEGRFPSAAATILDRLAETCDSLRAACEQGKAAILYPPRGMHMLLLGETGVGKSMFAECLHRYAVEVRKLAENAPFITFNCADYANNPQLLLGQLFGVKKGAFTGAQEQRGLLEIAGGGMLFLDEVHRLPAEGQEMLFTFIDKGCFRRLGETESERTARVLLIAATTENPGSSLLKTFTRRIPMVIELPPLRERSGEERYRLILSFFKEEAIRLGQEILVSPEVIRALLYYRCPNNVGQLKVDIQLLCAKAFSDYVTKKKEKVRIRRSDLPPHIKEGLYCCTSRRNKIDLHEGFYVFHPAETDELFGIAPHHDPEQTVYEQIERTYRELKDRGVDEDELDLLMEIDIENYFTYYLRRVNRKMKQGNLINMVRPEILQLTEEILKEAEAELGRSYDTNVTHSLAVHIQNTVDRIQKGGKIVHPQLNQVRRKYKAAFVTAIDCLKKVEDRLHIDLPIDEAGFLTMFFVMDPAAIRDAEENVQILVLAHGNGSARAMADVANQLLETDYASGIDIPLSMTPDAAFERVKKEVRPGASGVLLLVDMGSLIQLGERLEAELNLPVKVVPMVSTLHVLEAVRKGMQGCSLEQLYEDLKPLIPFDAEPVASPPRGPQTVKGAIVTACLTGRGSALAIQKALENYLTFNRSWLEIIPLQADSRQDLMRKLARIQQKRNLICIVSNLDVEGELPQFRVDDVLNLKAVDAIQQLIDTEETYCKMAEALENHLHRVDPAKVLSDVKRCLGELQIRLNRSIPKGDLIGVVLHACCMVDRLVSGDDPVSFKNKGEYIRARFPVYRMIRDVFGRLEERYQIELSDDEICYLMEFFDGAKAPNTVD